MFIYLIDDGFLGKEIVPFKMLLLLGFRELLVGFSNSQHGIAVASWHALLPPMAVTHSNFMPASLLLLAARRSEGSYF